MPKESSENSNKADTDFKWLVICFILFIVSLPSFYFGSGGGEEGSITLLIVFGFVFLVSGMLISISVKS